MRILFFLHNVSKARHFDGVMDTLVRRGHTVVLAAARQRNRALALPKNLVRVNRELIAAGQPGRVEITACPVRRLDAWALAAPALRQARDYLRFFDSRYANASKLEQRAARNVPAWWLRTLEHYPWLSSHWRMAARALTLAEDAMPTDRLFDLFIAYEQPDVVLVTPLVDYGSYQTDYVKSAHRLGVPVLFLPFSWDNLTNRGLIRVQPDRVIVWNDIQQREAVELHGVPRDRVTITGAPRFDAFFAMQPATSRDQFCAGLGLDAAQPLLLYLCSSEFVAPRETEFVLRWVAHLRQSSDERLRRCGVLIRPHPAHPKPWKTVNLASLPNVALWTEKETMNADQGLYDSLHHAAAVIGLNTSAMIEAGILGTPVFTVTTDEFAGGQEQTLHFHYLRAVNGGLLHEAAGLEEHVQQLSAALRGTRDDGRAVRFVERFVRPRGLDKPVAPIMADEIERGAAIDKRPARPAPWHYAARAAIRAALASRAVTRRGRPARH